MPDSPVERSSSTLTGGWEVTAAAHSAERTRRKSTVRPATLPAGSPRISLLPAWRRKCEVQLAYAIGVVRPVSIMVNSLRHRHDAGRGHWCAVVGKVFDLRPLAIIEALGLRRPIYRQTAAYGHFGRAPRRDGGFSWERTDRVRELLAAV